MTEGIQNLLPFVVQLQRYRKQRGQLSASYKDLTDLYYQCIRLQTLYASQGKAKMYPDVFESLYDTTDAQEEAIRSLCYKLGVEPEFHRNQSRYGCMVRIETSDQPLQYYIGEPDASL